jgi:hypothetical protein
MKPSLLHLQAASTAAYLAAAVLLGAGDLPTAEGTG